MARRLALALLAPLILAVAGCQEAVHFPAQSDAAAAQAAGALGAYDAGGAGKADFFTLAGADGRINRIAYARDGNGAPDEVIDLDAIPSARCRHLVIILDGFGYDVVKEYYDAGGLRLCHPPSRVLAPYPAMTDLALADVLGTMPCTAFQVRYYDRQAGRERGGFGEYLEHKNGPYRALLQYQADRGTDAVQYLDPAPVFRAEINDVKTRFDRRDTQEFIAYFVSSAGLSTRLGAEGQRQGLRGVERLINQIVYETRGLVKVTVTADHGHTYTPPQRIPLEEYLAAKGWTVRDRLEQPKDVVYTRFGLVTFASFSTRSPEALARDLAACEGVELASYADRDAVVVLGAGREPNAPAGAAVIRTKNGRYRYEATSGDPLSLRGILPRLKADADGYYDANDLLAATMTHLYPASLERLWRAHFALVENPPDVIVSLADRYYSGEAALGGKVNIASTHGGLSYRNSTTFLMSSIGPLSPYMRSREVSKNLAALIGRPWPLRR